MVKMLMNELRSDGEMQMIFGHFADEVVRLERYVPAPILRGAAHFVDVRSRALDRGGRETMVTFPALNAVQFRLGGGWRTFFVVHRNYGTGVRDCVRLGLEAWRFVGGGQLAVDGGEMLSAFVWRLPRGAENGVEITPPTHSMGTSPAPLQTKNMFGEWGSVHLFEAEWMPANCVAVG